MDARPFCRALRPGFAGLGFLGFLVAKQPLPERGLRLRLVRNVLLTWVLAVRPEIRLGVVGVCMANVSDQLTARSFTEAACEKQTGWR
jgi:ABC-type dipeptide/oligopeptide/nickel transport system permease subunit